MNTGAATNETRWTGWAPRPVLTLLVRGVCLAIPVVAGILAGALAAHLLPAADGLDRVAWWLAVLAVATAATLAADGLARRLLPLTVLLRLTLAFPDHEPSRLRVAMRATSVRRLRARVTDPSHRDLPDAERAADIVALAAALNAHDRRTRGHSERVQALTRLVAEQMHLDPQEQERLGWAAFLHDIGKLEVPTELLNKAGPPDDDEWAVLRRHPEEGERLVAPLRAWLGDAVGAIGEHHERYDGTGYPRGAAGEEISQAGRIVAVVDAFETITAPRSYKRPTPPAEARAELTRCAGSHFDPHVVRAFLGVSLGRMRWVIGIAGFLALLPIFSTARARAATLRPAVAGTGTGLVGAAVASIVLATAPIAPLSGPTNSVAAPRNPDASLIEVPSLAATALAAITAAIGGGEATTAAPPADTTTPPDPSLVRAEVQAAGLSVVAQVLGGVEVTPTQDDDLGVDISAPIIGQHLP